MKVGVALFEIDLTPLQNVGKQLIFGSLVFLFIPVMVVTIVIGRWVSRTILKMAVTAVLFLGVYIWLKYFPPIVSQ
jgi:hypothetical protein